MVVPAPPLPAGDAFPLKRQPPAASPGEAGARAGARPGRRGRGHRPHRERRRNRGAAGRRRLGVGRCDGRIRSGSGIGEDASGAASGIAGPWASLAPASAGGSMPSGSYFLICSSIQASWVSTRWKNELRRQAGASTNELIPMMASPWPSPISSSNGPPESPSHDWFAFGPMVSSRLLTCASGAVFCRLTPPLPRLPTTAMP